MARKTHTSYEVTKRWQDKTYKRYTTNLRYDSDGDIINFIEENKDKYGTTNIFRDALEMYMKAGVLD